MNKPTVSSDCVLCYACFKVCPRNAIVEFSMQANIYHDVCDTCDGATPCVHECTIEAITMGVD